jgi:hypothetical protein
MKLHMFSVLILAGTAGLTGCTTRTVNGLPVIATDNDQSIFDRADLPVGQAGIVYDPDGCQAWIIDDGLEGFASRRRDRSSGLPVCNDLFPPGTVVNEYRTNNIIEINPS